MIIIHTRRVNQTRPLLHTRKQESTSGEETHTTTPTSFHTENQLKSLLRRLSDATLSMFTALSLVVTFLTLSPTCNAVVSFVEGCEPMDGQFYGTDKVGFYCMVADGTWFDYKYSM